MGVRAKTELIYTGFVQLIAELHYRFPHIENWNDYLICIKKGFKLKLKINFLKQRSSITLYHYPQLEVSINPSSRSHYSKSFENPINSSAILLWILLCKSFVRTVCRPGVMLLFTQTGSYLILLGNHCTSNYNSICKQGIGCNKVKIMQVLSICKSFQLTAKLYL